VIPGDPKKCCVFEGFFDFLSWKIEHNDAQQTIIVLNTLALIESGITIAKRYSDISLFFDRDNAGINATKHFMAELPYAGDHSKLYEGFNDYNDKIKQLSPNKSFSSVKPPIKR